MSAVLWYNKAERLAIQIILGNGDNIPDEYDEDYDGGTPTAYTFPAVYEVGDGFDPSHITDASYEGEIRLGDMVIHPVDDPPQQLFFQSYLPSIRGKKMLVAAMDMLDFGVVTPNPTGDSYKNVWKDVDLSGWKLVWYY